jgi:cytochrome c
MLLAGMVQACAAGNAATGGALFNRCFICHSTTKGAPNRMGPSLFGITGRKAGISPGFSYSSAMKNSGIIWTPAKLDAYLADPQKLVPGNNMPMAGISSAQQRADIVAYLGTLK